MTNNENRLTKTLLNKSYKTKRPYPEVEVKDMWGGFDKTLQDKYANNIKNDLMAGFIDHGVPTDEKSIRDFIEKVKIDMKNNGHILPWGYGLPNAYKIEVSGQEVKITFRMVSGWPLCKVSWKDE